ncbi:SAC3/GANP/Nin1/mts3/eIF-3 p25 family-domain-containing protein [Hypoxylon sp. FL1150]|nr:SAC3/GANP/Nin1/mts3/eIF-3 p25 family-domain-containing protein [Hypoxylon sp. FL1150]
MLNSQRQGGWGGFGQPSNPTTNPFASASSQPKNPFATSNNSTLQRQPNGVAPVSNPFLARPSSPFGAASSAKPSFGAPSGNPFGAPTTSIDSAKNHSESPSSQRGKSPANPNPFAQSNNAHQRKRSNSPALNPFPKRSSPALNATNAPIGPVTNSNRKVAEYVKPAWPKQAEKQTPAAGLKAPNNQTNGKRKSENENQRKSKFSRTSPDPDAASLRSRSAAGNTKQGAASNNGSTAPRVTGNTSTFAETIMNQLAKDNIKPPRWPVNPGRQDQRQVIERFRETHKAYRERARKSLMRAGLIDDPDKKRRLDEALVFKGICEDFCPEWEKITRIVEHDIKLPEKVTDDNGELVPMPSLMVKRLARSAAGQESPLPMDVRSVTTLRRTLDYLINDLIPSDALLSSRHSFLWDRTRAIRIDFSFQKYDMTPEELKDQVYCLETIARFHVTALHILSQDGFTPGDYSEQQEIEQLGKTLMSLIEVYDDCAQQDITCENEAEFRGYYIIFNVHTPALLERVSNWHGRGDDPDRIKSAIHIVQIMKNIRESQGPLSPNATPGMALENMSTFFDAIAKPDVSYTLACFTEIHFNYVRKSILQTLKKSFSRPRFGPKDLTPAVLKQYLRTDTEEEAVEFFQKHGFQFSDGYVMLSPSPEYVDARVPHSFSKDIVERKRCGRSLPTIIHETVYEIVDNEHTEVLLSPEDSLFVSEDHNMSSLISSDGQDVQENQGRLESEWDSEATADSTPPASPRPLPAMFGNHAVTMPSASIPSPSIVQPSDVGSRSPSLSSVASASTDLSTTPLVEVSTDVAPKPDASSPNQTPVTSNVPTEQPMPEKTSLYGSVSGAPSPFNFLNKNESKDAPSPSIFSSLSSKTSEKLEHKLPTPATSAPSPLPEVKSNPSHSSNKDQPQQPFPLGTPTTPSLGFNAPTPSASINPFSGLSSNKDEPRPSFLQPATSILPPTSDATQPTATSTLTSPSSIKAQPTAAPTAQQAPTTLQQWATPQPQDIGSKDAPTPTGDLFLSQSSDRTISPTAAQTARREKALDDFTRWFVCGDKGLMDERLLEIAVGHALDGFWERHQAEEEERKRKQELEESWAAARKYREYSLGVKYFYRWHQGFRDRQRIRRMKVEREKARIWYLPENIAKRELAAKEEQERIARQAEESMIKRSRRNVDEAVRMRQSARLEARIQTLESKLNRPGSSTSSVDERLQGLEDALIATGVFKGVRDERAAAHHAAGWNEDEDADRGSVSRRAENHRRTKHGLNPLKALPEPPKYKEGSKTAMLKARYNGSGRDNMSMTNGSLRNSTFSSSYRSSLGHNDSKVSKSRSRVSDPYWRLKARGLVKMPNGEYLHESIALPMLQEGKRIPGFGNYGLPPAQTTTPDQSPPMHRYSSPPIQFDGIRPDEPNSSPSSIGSRKRKRNREDEEVHATPDAIGSPNGSKRAKSDIEESVDAQTHLADIARLLQQAEDCSRNTSSRVRPTSWTKMFK